MTIAPWKNEALVMRFHPRARLTAHLVSHITDVSTRSLLTSITWDSGYPRRAARPLWSCASRWDPKGAWTKGTAPTSDAVLVPVVEPVVSPQQKG